MGYTVQLPKRLHLELTSKCNYKCIICRHGYVEYGKDIDNKVQDIIINELIPNAAFLELQGTGETLLYKDLQKILDIAQKYTCKTTLITNASLLKKENLLMLAKVGCQIVVSIDSVNSNNYTAIRKNGDLNKVINNLSFWKFIKNNIRGTRETSLTINMVLCALNYQELLEMIDFAIEIDADNLHISEIRPYIPNELMWKKLALDDIKKHCTLKIL